MTLWLVHGKGQCVGTVTAVLAESAEAAIRKLTSDIFSPYFDWVVVEAFSLRAPVMLQENS